MMARARQSAGLALVTRPERVEAALWRRLRRDADANSRDQLVEHYEYLALTLANRRARLFGADAATRSDLRQAAIEGLLEAIDRYDPARNVPFSAYAKARINGALSDALARLTERGAISSQTKKRDRERYRSIIDLATRGSMSPVDELANIAVQLALALLLEGQELSDEGQVIVQENAFDSLAWRQLSARLTDAVAMLPDSERTVIVSHYHQEMLFADIATTRGVTPGRVSQLHKAALERLAKKMGKSR
jgi:RNA polymerase sigma factor FliA